jgi:hypothetical protein
MERPRAPGIDRPRRIVGSDIRHVAVQCFRENAGELSLAWRAREMGGNLGFLCGGTLASVEANQQGAKLGIGQRIVGHMY